MQYIFLHGLVQRASSWDKTISFLPQCTKIACPDLIDISEGELTYESIYSAFTDFCNKFSEPLCVCGLSVGGIIALNYVIDNPEKVKSLVLIGAQYKMPKTMLKIQNMLFKIMPNSAFKNTGMTKHELIKWTTSMFELNFRDKLKDISCKTLIICGEKDKSNINAAKELSEHITNAKFTIIKNAGHLINTEMPQELAAVMSEFYTK